VVGCNKDWSVYGGGTDDQDYSTDGVFSCTKCDSIYVCHQCLNGGGHAGHKKYLVPKQ
jgi:hypothetical protein